jgi:type IV pilus assembly protein PilB
MAKKLRLGEMLVEAGMISEDDLHRALTEGRKNNLRLGQQLVRQGTVKENDIVDLVCRQMGLAKYSPHKHILDYSLAQLVTAEMASKYKVVPISREGHLLLLGMTDPMDLAGIDAIEVATNHEVEPVMCTERELSQLTSTVYGMSASLEGVLGSIESEESGPDLSTGGEPQEVQVSSLQDMAGEAPVVRLVNSLLSMAVREGASDLHISPEKHTAQFRVRIDGKLKELPPPPQAMVLPIISRLKILAKMDIAVSRVPQDGRFTISMERKEINVRASTMPTIYGENMVLRLLDMSSGGHSLAELGMWPDDMAKIRSVIGKPYGMILSTGPTGSGKSSSLYAILREVNRPDINIITLEDPVEYRMEGVRQAQLNRKAGMTFASGLRSILRQDPDVIMVGEIRDAETAAISVQAALTGHRVLSTVHTNDSAGAVTRLMDMGIEPFLVSSVLLVSFAQRLVRTICPHCKEAYQPSKPLLEAWGLTEDRTYVRGKGCYVCGSSGYKGRTGIFEILLIDSDIQEMILRRKTSQEITRYAVASGRLRTLKEDAKLKVLDGRTTFEEAGMAVMV